ncbi:MAG TPA: YdcF family protein, partial [Cytophagaceae bacterium]
MTSFFLKNIRFKKVAFIVGLSLLLLFTNEFLSNEANTAWEYKPVALSDVKPHTVGIVLTGITSANREPHDRVYINYGADRVLHAVHLYRIGKIEKILVTGGEVSLIRKVSNESEDLIKVFLLCGVKKEDIIQEGRALNTRENAVFSKKIL